MSAIELPFPHKILWPNGRGHHMAKHREFQKHKSWAMMASTVLKGFRLAPGATLSWSITVYPKTAHKIDRDNALAAMKAYQDGIALALGYDDSRFETPTLHFAEPSRPGKVVIVIGECG